MGYWVCLFPIRLDLQAGDEPSGRGYRGEVHVAGGELVVLVYRRKDLQAAMVFCQGFSIAGKEFDGKLSVAARKNKSAAQEEGYYSHVVA